MSIMQLWMLQETQCSNHFRHKVETREMSACDGHLLLTVGRLGLPGLSVLPFCEAGSAAAAPFSVGPSGAAALSAPSY